MEIHEELAALRDQLFSMQGQLVQLLARPQVKPLPQLLSSAAVMKLLGYSETEPFLRAARVAGCPMIRINARKILFDQEDLRAWLEKLKNPALGHRIQITHGTGYRRRGPLERKAC